MTPTFHLDDIQPIDLPSDGYLGWPTLARTTEGHLLLAYSGGRAGHVCPFGQVHLSRSMDQGRTWSWPRTLVDGPLDDRDAGLLRTASGAMLLFWFSSMAWRETLEHNPEHMATVSADERCQWQLRQTMLPAELIQRELGTWCLRSTDGGHTWSPKIDTQVSSPHGAMCLTDGSLLYPGKRRRAPGEPLGQGSPMGEALGVAVSTDDGRSWQWRSGIEPMPGDSLGHYHEPHGVQAADGRIVMQLRSHAPSGEGRVLQTTSFDQGHSWTALRDTGLWGYPPFLLRTGRGHLITTLGHRREPRGIQIAVSEDHGATWSPQRALVTDAGGDFGYPSTVEIEPNTFLTVWYDRQRRDRTFLRQVRWSLG